MPSMSQFEVLFVKQKSIGDHYKKKAGKLTVPNHLNYIRLSLGLEIRVINDEEFLEMIGE
jgi:hypothetical protein